MKPYEARAFMYIFFTEVNMKQKNETPSEIDVKGQILVIQDKIDEELSKPECEIDMTVVDTYFKQIRELDGGVYEKSEEEISEELKNIYKKANTNKKKTILWYLNTTGTRVAAIFIVIGVFLGFSVGVYAVRKPIVEFFLNVKEKFSEVFFEQEAIDNAPDTIETVYTLGYVPEGYELVDTQTYKKYTKSVWKDQNEEEIILNQQCIGTSQKLDNENNDFVIFYINTAKVVMREKFHQKEFYWNNDNYTFMLSVPIIISDQESTKIIESIINSN